MTRPSQAEAASAQQLVLVETLRLAVPLWMRELHDHPVEQLLAAAAADSVTVGSYGDDLQYGGKHCADAFHALARGLAISALLADGGVDFLGLHWCAAPGCQATSRFDHAPTAPPPEAPTA